jgi:oligopeptide transport system substrate-binding protein
MRLRLALTVIGLAIALAVGSWTGAPGAGPRVFRWAAEEPTEPIDPRLSSVPATRPEIYNLFEGLIQLDARLETQPAEAERYEVSADGLTWTFHLRHDLKWSDGTPVSARDYEYAIKSALDPKGGSRIAAFDYFIKNAEAYNTGKLNDPGAIGVAAVDDYTLQIQLEHPSGGVLRQLATAPSLLPVPRQVVQKLGPKWIEAGNMVTNGPFKMTEWQHSQRMVWVPNPSYTRTRPGVDRVEVRLIADPGARALPAFEAGELDFAEFPGSEIPRIRASAQYRTMLQVADLPRLYLVMLDTGHKPFNDERVRRAFYLALDRDKISQLYNGLLKPAWTVIPTVMPGHSDGVRLRGSVADAQRLLAEAGYPSGNGFPTLTMVVRATQDETLFGQAAQSMWKANLGVDLKIQTLEAQAFRAFRDAIKRQPYDLFNTSATADLPDPWIYHNFMMGTDYYSSRWRLPKYMDLVARADRETDPARRNQLYVQADRMLIEDYTVVIPWAFESMAYVVRPSVKGIRILWGSRAPLLTDVQVTP